MPKISCKYINFAYLLRQYLRILTHPIIHFDTVSNIFQYLKNKFLLRANGGGLTPKTPPLPTPLVTIESGDNDDDILYIKLIYLNRCKRIWYNFQMNFDKYVV